MPLSPLKSARILGEVGGGHPAADLTAFVSNNEWNE